MKIDHLQPFTEPVVEKQTCKACKSYAPDCLVPVGDGAVPMCWLCAHHVTEHDTAVEHARAAECECQPSEIYPARSIASRGGVVHGDVDYDNMKPGDWTRQSELSAAVADYHKKVYESMTPKQREIVHAAYTRGSTVSVAAVREDGSRVKPPKRP